jgi:hypothetical protein
MPTFLQTVFAAYARLAEGQILHEEPTVDKGKSLKFRVGTRMPTVRSKEGQIYIHCKH